MSELNRIRDLLDRNRSRLEAFRESADSKMGSVVKEIEEAGQLVRKIEGELSAADERIREREDTISGLKDNLKQLRLDIDTLRDVIGVLGTRIAELEKRKSKLEEELGTTKQQLEETGKELEGKRSRLEELRERAEQLQREVEETRKANESEFAEQKQALEEAKRRLEELREANVVVDYLLTEGSAEPPELGILATLLRRREATVEELKRSAKVPPAIATRHINALQQKGIIEVAGGRVRLVKPI